MMLMMIMMVMIIIMVMMMKMMIDYDVQNDGGGDSTVTWATVMVLIDVILPVKGIAFGELIWCEAYFIENASDTVKIIKKVNIHQKKNKM